MQLMSSDSPTMSSREIAELVGSKHEAVRKSAERLASDQLLTSPLATFAYEHRGNTYYEFRFNKRDSLVLVARLSPAFTAKVVDRWQELESSHLAILPKSFSEALRLAADQQEKIEHQAHQLAIAAPKVEFVDQYVDASGSMTFRQVAKLLGANERKFRGFLTLNRIMYRLGGEWTAYQNHIEAGRFEVKTGNAAHNDHAYTSARFTPKGVEWVSSLWRSGKDAAGITEED